MKTKTIITALAIGLSIGIVSQAWARMGESGHYNGSGRMMGRMMDDQGMGQMMNGRGMGRMMGANNNFSLSPEQQQQVKDIDVRHQDELQAKEEGIRLKIVELDKAYANDTTTIAQVNALRDDLYNLKQEYRQTRITINNEISKALGSAYFGSGGWGPQYCLMDGMYMGGSTGGSGQMMNYNSGYRCRW